MLLPLKNQRFFSILNIIMKKGLFSSRAWFDPLILGLYFVLTLILTYPLIFNLTSAVPGKGGDVYQVLWRFNSLGKDFQVQKIWDPDQPLVNLSAIPYLPLHWLLGEPLAYNLIWLASFFLAGFGCYLLVNKIIRNKWAAFISGFFFAFAPYHFAHALGHFGALQIMWLPFFVLYLIKFFEKINWKNFILAMLFLTIIAWEEHHYLAFSLIFLFLYVFYQFFQQRRLFLKKKFWFYFFLFVALFVVFVILPYYPTIKLALSADNFLKQEGVQRYSLDLASIFIPSFLHSFWGGFFQKIAERFSGNLAETTAFAGWSVLAILLLGFPSVLKNSWGRFFLVVFFVFWLLSLGPVALFLGKNLNIPLPYVLIENLPFFDIIRTIGRFFAYALLALAVLLGITLSSFTKKNKIILFLFFVILFLEFLSFPYPLQSTSLPLFYEKLKTKKGDFSILEIPAATNYELASQVLYFQSLHNKNIFSQIALERAQLPEIIDAPKRIPLIKQLLFLQEKDLDQNLPNEFGQKPGNIGKDVLSFYQIRYIILHKNFLASNSQKSLAEFLTKKLNLPKSFENDDLVVWENKNKAERIFAERGEGWLKVDRDAKGDVISELASTSEIIFVNPHSGEKNLSFSLVPQSNTAKTAKIIFNDQEITVLTLDDKEQKIDLKLKPGKNILRVQLDNAKATWQFQNFSILNK